LAKKNWRRNRKVNFSAHPRRLTSQRTKVLIYIHFTGKTETSKYPKDYKIQMILLVVVSENKISQSDLRLKALRH